MGGPETRLGRARPFQRRATARSGPDSDERTSESGGRGCSVARSRWRAASQRLRKELRHPLSRFDALARLERFPDGLTA
jgi:hypothetical protein